ncbi:suppressor of fused domain protein [Paenibacillus sp. 1781tsa1]|uniref:suppressor of fused domain protein n=1 Tax=Paenibacillus sp. 1781tsa1 TaxID=2953810 RepID=UPI0020A1AA9E|nr:suppressor of fused domain protein [Paenibacillus sp. 1781tsa1]MCP1185966.1 suppressor of fused domain protein [Paenibacillus sp. 1781tsa1]
MTYEENTSGWDAIDKAIGELYGEQEPHHYGTSIPYMLGGPDPLDGISVYAVNTPMPHWHFVTYGFSELYEKEMQDASKSGYGFELTFRLTRSEGETDPPAWALNLLQNVGRYVFTSGNIFQPGDYMDANGPICLESDTLLTALSFIEDPDLPANTTPNGSVQFIQMVGITGRELEMIQTWNARGFLSACSNFMPKYVTDLMRNSYADIPSVVQAVKHGMEQDGSSTAFLFIQQLAWESPRKKMLIKTVPGKLQLGAKQAVLVGTILRSRISKGASLSLIGPDTTILFEAGEHPAVLESDRQVTLTVNEQIVEELAENLQPIEGTFEITSLEHMLVQIVKTEIKNQEGQVIKTIG